MLKLQKVLILSTIAILTLAINVVAYAGIEHFEKGDLLFRSGPLWYGHTGIYYKWDDDEDNDPENREDHSIIEAPGRGKLSWKKSYQYFYNSAAFKRGGSKNLTAQQRQRVIELAEKRLDWKYALTEGYKDRLINGKFSKTYRCDGLAEHCYEIALSNYGIVKDYHWDGRKEGGLYPYGQMNAMMLSKARAPRVKINEIVPIGYKNDQCFIKDMVAIKSSADDGAQGSGIAQVEFWLDYPDATPNDAPGIRRSTDDHNETVKGDYSYNWYTPFEDDGQYTVYAKAFDQAGNTKVSEGIKIIVNNIPPVIINESPTGQISETKPPISATIESEDGIVAIDLDSIAMTLDGLAVTPTVTPETGGSDITITYTPTYDLDIGEHAVVIDAKDAIGLVADEKTWSFIIASTEVLPPDEVIEDNAETEAKYNWGLTIGEAYSKATDGYHRWYKGGERYVGHTVEHYCSPIGGYNYGCEVERAYLNKFEKKSSYRKIYLKIHFYNRVDNGGFQLPNLKIYNCSGYSGAWTPAWVPWSVSGTLKRVIPSSEAGEIVIDVTDWSPNENGYLQITFQNPEIYGVPPEPVKCGVGETLRSIIRIDHVSWLIWY